MRVMRPSNSKVHKNRRHDNSSGRLANLLGWLAAKPFLNGRQLVAVSRYTGVRSPLGPLAYLQKLGLVSHVLAPGGLDTLLHRYYYITRRGLGALARHDHVAAKDLAKRYWLGPRRLAQLVRALGHTEACHQFFVDIITYLENLEVPPAEDGLILWHGEAEAYQRYRLDGIDRPLRPDAFGGYRSGDGDIFFFLEWDSGNMAAGRHRRKILAYHGYRAWWYEHQPGEFPVLLVINPSQSHAAAMNHLVLTLASATHTAPLPVFVTTHAGLKESGPLGANWWDVAHQELGNPFNRIQKP